VKNKPLTEIQMKVIKKSLIKVTELNQALKELEDCKDKLVDEKTRLLEIIKYTRER